MLKKILLVISICLIFANYTFAENRQTIGVLDEQNFNLWEKNFKEGFSVKKIDKGNLPEKLKGLDILVVGEVGLSKAEVEEIEKYVKDNGRVIAYGTAGYADGKFNLTQVLKTGKHIISNPIMYPPYTCEKDFVPYAEWLIKNGEGSGISVFDSMAVMGRKYSNHEYLGEVPTYDKMLKNEIFPNLEKWMPKNNLRGYGITAVPKILYATVWMTFPQSTYFMSPEKLVQTAKDLGFSIIIFTVGHEGYLTHPTEESIYFKQAKDVPNDYLPRLVEECRKGGIQLWGDICILSVEQYIKIHPDQSEIILSGRKLGVCPRSGKDFYDWQYKVMKEILVKYPYISGITLNEPMLGMNCETCRAEYEKKYGKKADKNDPDFTAFREDTVRDLVIKPLVDTVKSVAPLCHIGIAIPASDASMKENATNLSKYADAGYDIWQPEYPRPDMSSREGRKLLNIEKSMTYHTPQKFNFDKLFYCEKSRDTESQFKDIQLNGTGVEVNIFDGALPVFWMQNSNGVKWPGVVKAENGKVYYFAFNPLMSEKTITLLKQYLK